MRVGPLAASALVILLSGCASPGHPPLTAAAADEAVDDALQDLAEALAGRDSDVRSVRMGPDSNHLEEGEDASDGLEFVWGRDGATSVKLSDADGEDGGNVEVRCFDDVTYFLKPNGTYAARSPNFWCRFAFGPPLDVGDNMTLVGAFALERIGPASLDGQGHATAAVRSKQGDEDAHEATVVVDESRHIVSLRPNRTSDNGALEVRYGARQAIERPADAQVKDRFSIGLLFDHDRVSSERFTGIVNEREGGNPTGGPVVLPGPPLEDLRLDILTNDRSIVVSFPMEQDATKQGIQYRYDDADGDGRVSLGDRYEVTGLQSDQDPGIFDEWANHYEGYEPVKVVDIPGPGLIGAIAAFAGLAAAARRRKQVPPRRAPLPVAFKSRIGSAPS